MKLDRLNIGIIGATGAVGAQALKLLSKRKHPIQKIFAFASKKSVGKKINYLGNFLDVLETTDANLKKIDVALISVSTEANNSHPK